MIETYLESTPDTNGMGKKEVIKREEIILSVSMVMYFICLVSIFMILLSVSIVSFTFLFYIMNAFKPLPKIKLADLTVKLRKTTTSTSTKTTATSLSPPKITTSLSITTLDYSESKTFGESFSDFSSDDSNVSDPSDLDWSDLWNDSSSSFTDTS